MLIKLSKSDQHLKNHHAERTNIWCKLVVIQVHLLGDGVQAAHRTAVQYIRALERQRRLPQSILRNLIAVLEVPDDCS